MPKLFASSIETVFEVVPFALHVSSCMTKNVFKFLWKGGGFESLFGRFQINDRVVRWTYVYIILNFYIYIYRCKYERYRDQKEIRRMIVRIYA